MSKQQQAELDAVLLLGGGVTEKIEQISKWRWQADRNCWTSPAGRDISRPACDHLVEEMKKGNL